MEGELETNILIVKVEKSRKGKRRKKGTRRRKKRKKRGQLTKKEKKGKGKRENFTTFSLSR